MAGPRPRVSCDLPSVPRREPFGITLYRPWFQVKSYRKSRVFFGVCGDAPRLRRRWCTNNGYCTALRVEAAHPCREASMTRDCKTTPVIALTEAQPQLAMERFAVLQ